MHEYLWMTGQVVYQIFPDRFAIGQPHTSETKLALPAYHRADDYVRRGWNDLPINPPWGKDFFGGDLQGIADHLHYLQDLGITTIYLTPIFTSPSNHKYETTDYFTVDAQFGGDEALRALIETLHNANMRLVMDAVLNHVSDQHPWFVKAKQGDKAFKDFFTFHPSGGYDCWRGYRHMPELNLANPKVQALLYRNPDSVLQKYLAMGLDGWRFDVAVDVGLKTIHAVRQVLRQRFPGAALIGEVMAYAARWTQGDDKYHGVMNYYFRDAVLSWLGGKASAKQMNAAVEHYYKGYGLTGALCSWNILSSHDTPRLISLLPDRAQRQLAIVAQFTLPGAPMVYYGEEIGMEGKCDPDCRRPMVWERCRWDREMLEFYKQLISIRQGRAELRRGRLILLGNQIEADMIAFIRHTEQPQEVALVLINNAETPVRQRLFTPHSHLYHSLPLRNLLCPAQALINMEAGNLDVDMPPRSAAILVPDDGQYQEYQYFKPRNLP